MQYYYHKDGIQVGPIELDELLKAPLTPETLVWQEGLPSWKPAKDFPELSELFSAETVSEEHPAPPTHTAPKTTSESTPRMPLSSIIPPPNYLAWSIVVTILCCWPLGIPAIIYASRVGKTFAMGDYKAAKRYSNLARNWTIASAVAGLVVVVVAVLLSVLSVGVFSTLWDSGDLYDFM